MRIKVCNKNRYIEFERVIEAHKNFSVYEPVKYRAGTLFPKNYVYFTDLLYEDSYDPLAIGVAEYLGVSMHRKYYQMFTYSIAAERVVKSWACIAAGSDKCFAPIPRVFYAYYISDRYLCGRLAPAAPVLFHSGTNNEVYRNIIMFVLHACTGNRENLIKCLKKLVETDQQIMFNAHEWHVASLLKNFVADDIIIHSARVIFSLIFENVHEIICYIMAHDLGTTAYRMSIEIDLSRYLSGPQKKVCDKIRGKYFMNDRSGFSDVSFEFVE